jgi:hypothetical protein
MPCAAFFTPDYRWYRAEIVNVIDKMSVEILYVDNGNIEKTQLFNLRHIKPEYMKFSVDVSILKLIK